MAAPTTNRWFAGRTNGGEGFGIRELEERDERPARPRGVCLPPTSRHTRTPGTPATPARGSAHGPPADSWPLILGCCGEMSPRAPMDRHPQGGAETAAVAHPPEQSHSPTALAQRGMLPSREAARPSGRSQHQFQLSRQLLASIFPCPSWLWKCLLFLGDVCPYLNITTDVSLRNQLDGLVAGMPAPSMPQALSRPVSRASASAP